MCFPYITTKYIITFLGGFIMAFWIPFVAHIKF